MYSALQVLTPPAQEPVSLDLVKLHARIDHGYDDALLPGYIATARSLAEQFLGRCLLTQSLRWTMAEVPPHGATPLLSMLLAIPLGLTWPQIWHRTLDLPRSRAQSVDRVAIRTLDGTDAVLDPSEYLADLDLEPGRLRLQPGSVSTCTRHVQVDFTAGYGDDPAAIPQPICHAVLMLAAWLYENRGDGEAEMPRAVERLLWPYRLVFFA